LRLDAARAQRVTVAATPRARAVCRSLRYARRFVPLFMAAQHSVLFYKVGGCMPIIFPAARRQRAAAAVLRHATPLRARRFYAFRC